MSEVRLVEEVRQDGQNAGQAPEPEEGSRLHPGLSPEKPIQLVHYQAGLYRVVEAGPAEWYFAETLDVAEPCACDGNQMPVGHRVYRDRDRGYAISAEHCEVIAEGVQVERECDTAYVWVVNPNDIMGRDLVGIWHHSHLVDNHRDDSLPWTRPLAEDALAGVVCRCGALYDADAFVCPECEDKEPCDRCGEKSRFRHLEDGNHFCADCAEQLGLTTDWRSWWVNAAITAATMIGSVAVLVWPLHPGIGPHGYTLSGTVSLASIGEAAAICVGSLIVRGALRRIGWLR